MELFPFSSVLIHFSSFAPMQVIHQKDQYARIVIIEYIISKRLVLVMSDIDGPLIENSRKSVMLS